MIYDNARKLADELKNSEEYRAYRAAKERAFQNDSTKNLIAEYHKLQRKTQASVLGGETNQELMQQLQKLGEVLQFDADAAAFLMAEYRLNTMLGDVYKILAEAIDIDLSALEG
ncbi:MAG: YlbF family regulator [Clostridia bacterium]|nr:YlbF family regulator [Clostridia bacterium]